jgi:uncharacterized protein YecE (DUF72 family)
MAVRARFPAEGSALERYGAVFDAVEINSSFYRSHQPKTYVRWRDSTPDAFQFSAKVPRGITHKARLIDAAAALEAFVTDVANLGPKLGPLLVQLPPSLAFDQPAAETFFDQFRGLYSGQVVCEPRHLSWFDDRAEALLRAVRVSRVAADPAPHPRAASPGGWPELAYWRLHGSPKMYFSAYSEAQLSALAQTLGSGPAQTVWCIFDNTGEGAAAADALTLQALQAD